MRVVCSKPGSAKPPCALHFISDGEIAITPGSAECATAAKDRKAAEALTAQIVLIFMARQICELDLGPPSIFFCAEYRAATLIFSAA